MAFDPFAIRGSFVPLAAGGALLTLTLLLAWWRRAGDRVAAVAAGLFAAWLAMALQVALNGTPFGFGGLGGDQGRMSAAVTRYMVTPWLSDGIVEGVTSEYPPLFPWLVGRTARLVGVPAWQLLPLAQILLTSFAVLAAFLMWQRLVPPPVALACSAVGLLVFSHPNKAYSVITLFVFVPWLIASFANPPRGRLHWLPAGIIGGLIILSYYGWFPFSVIGVLIILVAAWRRAENRKRYVLHVLGIGITATVVASPYLVAYGHAMLTKGGQTVSDLYQSFEIPDNGFPFLEPTLLGALQLTGLAGLVWYRQRTWWAWPLLYLCVGSYLFWVIMGVRYVLNEHTMLIHYVPRLTGITLAAAGVLTLAFGAPALARRLNLVAPYRFGAAVIAVTMVWVGFTYWHDWRPRPTLGSTPTSIDLADYSTLAHLERLPDCTYPLYPPERRPVCLPVNEIRGAVESSLGEGARPATLSFSEQLFSFLPWRGYMGIDRTSANSLVHWDDRYAEVIRLSQVRDPAEFARQSANTKFGPIDVFVLAPGEGDTWNVIDMSFRREQFDPSQWTIVDDLSQPLMVAIRKP
jgi:hypothetical protein